MANSGFLKNGKISASQIETWIKSPKDYIKKYIVGEPFIDNKYTIFGKKIHKLIEDNDLSVEFIPKLKNKEVYFEEEFDGSILNGFIDSIDEGIIFDYKISKNPWTQTMVDKNNQLKFYALFHKIKYGFLPSVSIIHIESDDTQNEMSLTGKIRMISKQIEFEDLEYIINQIQLFKKWCEEYESSNN
jgi:hypothetical protein